MSEEASPAALRLFNTPFHERSGHSAPEEVWQHPLRRAGPIEEQTEPWHRSLRGANAPVLTPSFLTLLLLVLIACCLATSVAARATGEPVRRSACVGVLMNTRVLMELVAINAGLELGLPSREVFTMLVLMALSTTFLTTPLLRLSLSREDSAPVGQVKGSIAAVGPASS